ncbi:MAG TPA: peptide chain release factor 2 [Thermomicrobiaceae bacterium]|nr:peptide chain release factor 2 [Thermomicrobiaceae bacterium]
MSQPEQMPESIDSLLDRLDRIGVRLDLPNKQLAIQELDKQSAQPGFWDDVAHAQRVMRRVSGLRAQVDRFNGLHKQATDLQELTELALDDPAMQAEVDGETADLQRAVDALELELLLNGPYDEADAILAVHAGTGGVDAQDWAEMLLRMYLRWAANAGFKAEVLDTTEGEEAGIKSATIELSGLYAYGYAKSEAGTHRLVRLSPFDAAHRRHTAFALVEVLPQVDDDDDIVIRDEDLRVDTYRSSGAGGQHVNKTSSAVRITHLPTGIVVTCQNERSQLQNRETAMKILRARLTELQLREREEQQAALKGEYTTPGWGNRIRSYVLQPYTMVTDHRTEYSAGDIQAVLNGEIGPFIDAYLHQQLGEAQKS